MDSNKKLKIMMALAFMGLVIIALFITYPIFKNRYPRSIKYSSKDEEEAEDAVDSLLNTLGIKKQSDLTDIDED